MLSGLIRGAEPWPGNQVWDLALPFLILLGTRVLGVCPRGEREEGGEGALKKAVRLNHLVSEQTAGSPLSIVCCWEDVGQGESGGG